MTFMFSGPAPGLLREQGALDARAGKPPLMRDANYRRGYELAGGQLPPAVPPRRNP